MKNILVKYKDGSLSRWNAKEIRLGEVRWSVSKYDKNGYYMAHCSASGISPIEDYLRNVDSIMSMRSDDFEAVTA